MNWLFVSSRPTDDFAHYQRLKNFANDYQLDMGVSLVAEFPADAEVRMDPDFPDQIALADCLRSNPGFLVVGARVRQLFEAQSVKNVEWLPVRVINHKGKWVKSAYYVLNILTSADCIDRAKSIVEWNDIDPDMINTAKQLVLDKDRLPTDVKLFRPVHLQYETMIHRSLVDAITAGELSGFSFTEIADYKS